MQNYNYRGEANDHIIINYIIDMMPGRITLGTPIPDEEIDEQLDFDAITLGSINAMYTHLLTTYGCLIFNGKDITLRIAEPKIISDCYRIYRFDKTVGKITPIGYDQFERIICFDQGNLFETGHGAIYAITLENNIPSISTPPKYISRHFFHFLAEQFDIDFILDDLRVRDLK